MKFNKLLALVLSTALVFAGFSNHASAAVIGTGDALSMEARETRIADIDSALSRTDVQQAMVELGVDPQQAQQRVASLSDAELIQLEAQLDTLPAGGGALALIGAVFLVLLILEITGVVDIFKKV